MRVEKQTETETDNAMSPLKEIISSDWAAQKLVPLTTRDFWNGKNPEVTERMNECRKRGKQRLQLKCTSLKKRESEKDSWGHLRWHYAKDWATNRLYWANVNAEAVKMVRNHCHCAKYQRQKHREAMTICNAPSRAWLQLAFDVFEHHRLLIIDYYSCSLETNRSKLPISQHSTGAG